MATYVIDAHAAIDLARRGYDAPRGQDLYAPTLLRSQVLAILHSESGDADSDQDRLALAERACRLPGRLLGDSVLRRTAWAIAEEHGWPETYDAEYIALTRLHGDALIAGSDALRAKAEPIVRTESVAYLLGQS
jgi:predicted nucleic acid-binding protein